MNKLVGLFQGQISVNGNQVRGVEAHQRIRSVMDEKLIVDGYA